MSDELIVIDTIFGSHLYGTNDENSDMDYKRIVIPDERDVILGRVFKSRHENTKVGDGKNTSDDVDVEIISISTSSLVFFPSPDFVFSCLDLKTLPSITSLLSGITMRL